MNQVSHLLVALQACLAIFLRYVQKIPKIYCNSCHFTEGERRIYFMLVTRQNFLGDPRNQAWFCQIQAVSNMRVLPNQC